MEGGRPTHGPDAGMEAYGKALFAEDPHKDWLTRECLWEATDLPRS
jgi:hypothetical protein